ncbi:MAG: cadherin repeat domain-containing protein [Cyanobacteria bacterium J06635_1]
MGDASSEVATEGEVETTAYEKPEIVSNGGEDEAFIKVDEGNVVVTAIEVGNADESGEISYIIKDGDDKDQFVIDQRSGVLSFKDVPDWESPTDMDKNNNYKVFVQAVAPNSDRDSQFLVVQVTNVSD